MALPTPSARSEGGRCTSRAWRRAGAQQGHVPPVPTLTSGGSPGPGCPFCVQSSGLLFKAHVWIWDSCGHHPLTPSANIGRGHVPRRAFQRQCPSNEGDNASFPDRSPSGRGGRRGNSKEGYNRSMSVIPSPTRTPSGLPCLCHLPVLGSPITSPRPQLPIFEVGGAPNLQSHCLFLT